VGNEYDRVNLLVDRLLKNRPLPRQRAGAQELEAIRMAIKLRAALTESELPDREFLTRLDRMLRTELGDMREKRSAVTRRRLIQAGALAAGATAAGAVALRASNERSAPGAPPILVPDVGSWRPVAASASLPENHALAFSARGVRGVLVNDGGTVRALSGVCTHLGCLLTVNMESRHLDCPCHQLAFSWDGTVRYYGVDSRPPALPQMPTRIRNGMIEVLLP
jgi:cytochrome b6-f complex iron-sulfur subunit